MQASTWQTKGGFHPGTSKTLLEGSAQSYFVPFMFNYNLVILLSKKLTSTYDFTSKNF